MAKVAIGFAEWPFEKGERAKLIKVSKPYVEAGSWYVEAVYLSVEHKKVRVQKHFWGDLHLLVVGAEYIDGIRQHMPNWNKAEIHLTQESLLNKQYEPYLKKDKKNSQFDCYTYGIGIEKEYYIISLQELVRGILAPDVFWLNQIIAFDSIDTRVIYEMENQTLNLNFSLDVPTRYVKVNSAMQHMAWIFTNPDIYDMLHQIHHNIRNNRGILFDFLFEELHIIVNYEEWDGRKYVREIINYKSKQINCNEIIITHPKLLDYDKKDGELEGGKKRPLDNNDTMKELVSDMTASPNVLDIELDESICCEYNSVVAIHRVKIPLNESSNDVTQTKSIKDIETNRRTTADFGGLETVPQLEFSHITVEKVEGDFAEILAIFQLMGTRKEVVDSGYHIGYLNDHLRNRAICTLDDGKTTRRYFAGKIKLYNGIEAILIEIQRENLAISTLMCVSHNSQDWNPICHKILKGFIANSGVWPEFEAMGFGLIEIYRFKHTDVDVCKKEKRIFESIK